MPPNAYEDSGTKMNATIELTEEEKQKVNGQLVYEIEIE